ncbi:MAG: hypothetical protein MJB57_06825 [Gemmatimonadetes bacterium]|nr:hypothetical protein [Gemmatimonadota bacterium]
MRDRRVDDGFELSDDGDLDMSGVDSALDVDLDFLDDVEAMGGASIHDAIDQAPTPTSDAMSTNDVAEFRARWADIQASFIDDPNRACEQADNLVDLVLNRLTERFTRERDGLVRQWDQGHEATDTEELRLAMKGYRGLIDRLLTAEL